MDEIEARIAELERRIGIEPRTATPTYFMYGEPPQNGAYMEVVAVPRRFGMTQAAIRLLDRFRRHG